MVGTSYSADWAFSVTEPRTASLFEDRVHGTDYSLGDLRIAYRKRRLPIGRYNDIALRYSRQSGRQTECDKLLDGSCLAAIYCFEYTDGWVIVRVTDLVAALREHKYTVRDGPDGSMGLIPLPNLPHLRVLKENI